MGFISMRGIHIDEQATQILNCGARAVKAILTRREQLDHGGHADKTLVVLAGECHTLPSNLLHHVKIMEGVRRAGLSLAAALETDHDLLDKAFESEMKIPAPPALTKQDDKGKLSLKTLLMCRTSGAAHARETMLHYMLRENIPTLFNDAAFDSEGNLNAASPDTAASIRDCLGEKALADTSWLMPHENIYVRNHFMAKKANSLIAQEKPRILYQMCGLAHVCGSDALRFGSAQSLSAAFKTRGLPVLALPFIGTLPSLNIAKKHGLQEGELFRVRGLPETEFGSVHVGEVSLGEVQFTEKLLEKSCLLSVAGSPLQRVQDTEKYKKELQNLFSSFIAPKGMQP